MTATVTDRRELQGYKPRLSFYVPRVAGSGNTQRSCPNVRTIVVSVLGAALRFVRHPKE